MTREVDTVTGPEAWACWLINCPLADFPLG